MNALRIRTPLILTFAALLVGLFALVPAGCGGGGGGAKAALVYSTDWTNRTQPGGGLSQRVQVFDLEGRLLLSIVINQDADGVQQTTLTGIGKGTYRLFAELFSQRDLGGVKTGELQALVTVNGNTVFESGVGDAVTSVGVSPPSASITVQQSKQFFATAYSLPGKATFVVEDGFSWTAFGGVATVDDNGLALGTAAGNGSIRATHQGTGLQGGATLTVTPFNTTNTKWTVLVYMNAANDLYSFSTLNMNQMEQVADNPDVRFVVQWKQSTDLFSSSSFNGTRRYLVKPDTTPSIASELIQDMGTNVDMGDPQTLNQFIQWGKTYYPSTRTVLVVWNHGNGWINRAPSAGLPTRGVSYDDQTGNYIRTDELGAALGNNVFDIVAWDASLMQMLEVAYEIKDQAHYVAGSEESPPGEGYPYERIFGVFRDTPDASTLTLSKAFVDGMLAVPQYANRKITQSVIDTAQLPSLATALDGLAGQLIANAGAIAGGVPTVRAQSKSYSPNINPPRYFYDLVDLCLKMESILNVPNVSAAASAVRTAVGNAVVWEGHNANSPGSNGVSIDFSPSSSFNASGYALDYSQLRLGQATRWDEWLGIAP